MDTFIADLQMSALCDERQYEHLDGDALAKLYDDPIAGLLDNLPAVAAWRVQRRQYFTLLQQKRSDFWTKRLDAEKSRPRADFGGRSMSCLVAAAEHLCHQTLVL